MRIREGNHERDLPDNQRIRVENRFFLIKECEDFCRNESERLGKKFRKTRATGDFCDVNGVHHATLYRYMRCYRESGIEGLVATKNKGPVAKTVLLMMQEIIEPGKGYKRAHNKLLRICEQRGIRAPSTRRLDALLLRMGWRMWWPKRKQQHPVQLRR